MSDNKKCAYDIQLRKKMEMATRSKSGVINLMIGPEVKECDLCTASFYDNRPRPEKCRKNRNLINNE